MVAISTRDTVRNVIDSGKNYVANVAKQGALGYIGGSFHLLASGPAVLGSAALHSGAVGAAVVAGVAAAAQPVLNPVTSLIGPSVGNECKDNEVSVINKKSESFVQLAGLAAQIWLRATVVSNLCANLFGYNMSKTEALVGGYIVPAVTDIVLSQLWNTVAATVSDEKKGRTEVDLVVIRG